MYAIDVGKSYGAMRILYVEPFEAGSHAQFGEVLRMALPAEWTRIVLPGRHWKWRMRSSAVYATLAAADLLHADYDVLFASSYLPLAELLGLAPALASVPRVLYFHENQLAYPSRGEARERDLHYGVTQLVSALAATACWFNSAYNRDSFLAEGRALLRRMPDAVPPGWIDAIEARARVVPPLLRLGGAPRLVAPTPEERALGPVILWNHRWEHDKNPEAFFAALDELVRRDVPFRVALAGERYRRAPEVFVRAQRRLAARIVHDAWCPSRAAYEDVLQRAHVAVSTANHEFFGMSMLEATRAGARPVVPRRLAYPELFPAEFLYDDQEGLVAALERHARAFVAGHDDLRADRSALTERFDISCLGPEYHALLRDLVAARVAR